MPAQIPEGYAARHPTKDDAPAVAELRAACEVADGDPAETTTEGQLSDWDSIDLTQEAVVITTPEGRIVASADVLNRRYIVVSVYGYVHPEHRELSLGSYLVAWGEDWIRDRMQNAPGDARIDVQHYIRASNDSARRLMEAHGYAIVRTIYVMAVELDGPPAPPEWPDGVSVRTFVPREDDQAVYEAGEEAFQDTWGRPPGTLERWMQPTRAGSFDPTMWFLAKDRTSGQVAGLCLCQVVDGKGWVGTVAVRRTWRRRGLGLALLLHAFGEYQRRGIRDVSLSVDSESPTGAPRLYSRAGMHVDRQYLLYRKELRPGRDLTTSGALEAQ